MSKIIKKGPNGQQISKVVKMNEHGPLLVWDRQFGQKLTKYKKKLKKNWTFSFFVLFLTLCK